MWSAASSSKHVDRFGRVEISLNDANVRQWRVRTQRVTKAYSILRGAVLFECFETEGVQLGVHSAPAPVGLAAFAATFGEAGLFRCIGGRPTPSAVEPSSSSSVRSKE